MTTVSFSTRQREIIVGKLLGDGHLETATNGKTYRLKIEHSIRQKAYVDWLYTEFGNCAASGPRVKTCALAGKIHTRYWFNTKYTPSLRFYAQQFYPKGKKVVPKLIQKWLAPLTLAVWFMDDGSVKSRHHRAKILNTQGFEEPDIERLIAALKHLYGINAQKRKQKEGYQIYLLADTIGRFEEMIAPYVLPSFEYKLG